jgi:hypothetical protein
MDINLTPAVSARLEQMKSETGLSADQLVGDALAGYLEELAETRAMLDNRYDEIKSGKVKPIDGEAFFEELRLREAALLQNRAST